MDSHVKTILVVDDEELIRQLIETVLKREGYRLLFSKDGEEAVDTISDETSPIDLLITDLCMPGLLGDQVAEIFQEKWPGANVIFASGSSGHFPMERLARIRNARFLDKPYFPRDLLIMVKDVFGEGKGSAARGEAVLEQPV